MAFIPFEKRPDVDQEHIVTIGGVTVYFLKKSEESSIPKAAKHLADAYEKRIMSVA